ncbi:unnamed protein product [Nippostrongylus brasiliensis]|uniref:Uncharacterized protein n=1 Tax=Nippostrongylus brasiliensis TaxID=27835 RepID=A0A0N4XV70_NIPBR|nr:unnamed protein product [Nippostrongylus brasiliensis]
MFVVVADAVTRYQPFEPFPLARSIYDRYKVLSHRFSDSSSSFPPHRAASSSQQSPTSGGGGAGDSGQWRRHASTLLESAETKTSLYSTTSESNNDAVNDYLTLVSCCC